jgi:hypothetical protein
MIYLIIILVGFNILIKVLLPKECSAIDFFRENACPDIFKFIQDFSFTFALLSILLINFLLLIFFKYKKINIKK